MAERSLQQTVPRIDELNDESLNIDSSTFLGQNTSVTYQEILRAEVSLQDFFHDVIFDKRMEIDYEQRQEIITTFFQDINFVMIDCAIQLARLNKLRIHGRLNISEETENMIQYAKQVNFTKALAILTRYPFIVNFIPTNSAWGLIHYAAYSNDFCVVKTILENPICNPSLCTVEFLNGIMQSSCTAYDIAQVERVKTMILEQQQKRLEEKGNQLLQTCMSLKYEEDIKVESIILILNCFINVLYQQTLQSRESLIYSNLMNEIFTFIDTGKNWKKARREISLQLQSLDVRDASFLATGQDKGDIMDDISEAKEDFYSRVIQLYNRDYRSNYGNRFHSALNRSFSADNYKASFFSLEDLALLAYGVLLNSILMYWEELHATLGTTYRGVYLTEKEFEFYRRGCTFTWFGFNSCYSTKEKAASYGNDIFVIDNRHKSVYGAKVMLNRNYSIFSNQYLYPSGVKFKIDRVEQKEFGTNLYVHLEDYSRKPTDYMFFRHDAPVIEQEIADAADSLHTYFENIEYDISRDFILSLAQLRKFRIQSSLNSLSQVTDEAIKNAKFGNFNNALSILDEYPCIVNLIPVNSAWGLIHQAAYFNDIDVVKKILSNSKCDPNLQTKVTRDGKIQAGSTAYDIAKDENLKSLILEHQEKKSKELQSRSLPTFVSPQDESEIEVESILLMLNCFTNVLYPPTLQSRESLIYSYLMLEIFTFIDTEENWKKARREISLQLQSLDIGDAAFLATGQDDGDIMDDTLEAKEDFYSRVIQLYTRDVTLTNSIYNNKFYSALNRSLLMHGCNDSFISGEDLALAAYGVLLNSILMYWRYLLPTNKPTYRAMKLTEQQLESYSAGCTFTWISFSSSSLCKERAKTFGKCIFVINNACTNRCKYSPKSIMDHSIYVNEQEYLYPSGAKFRIDYIQNKDGYTFFYVHLEDY